ncbi:MAG: ABC transporter ATP-binding protein [Paracoccaceae bacterium]
MTPSTKKAQEVVLRLSGITKRFGALVANDHINLTLHKGEVIALLGENGAGKTTLMNILFGQYLADSGDISAFGKPLPPGNPRAALAAGIGMVHQHFTLADQLTVLENIQLGTRSLWRPGLGRADALARVNELGRAYGLTVNPSAKVGTLTVGERQRVEILKALYRDARILILDEPTAVLTPQEADDLFHTLRLAVASGLSIVFISHKLHEVMSIADRCIVLRHGKVVGEVAARLTDRHALATMMVGVEVTPPKVAETVVGPALLRLVDVSTPNDGAAPGLKYLNLDLRAGQIVGLAGVSGNGQALVSDLISGLMRPKNGKIIVLDQDVTDWSPRAAVGAGIARIPEDRHKIGTIADFSLTENAILERYADAPFSRRGWMNWQAAEGFARQIIASYDVRCPGPGAHIRVLSGGNMQKLILGRVLGAGPKIVLANQPVRGLDIGAISYVHSQLLAARDAGVAVLLISEDLDEIMALSDVIHVISEGRLSPAFSRGTKSAADLGLWMAGHGYGQSGAIHAA